MCAHACVCVFLCAHTCLGQQTSFPSLCIKPDRIFCVVMAVFSAACKLSGGTLTCSGTWSAFSGGRRSWRLLSKPLTQTSLGFSEKLRLVDSIVLWGKKCFLTTGPSLYPHSVFPLRYTTVISRVSDRCVMGSTEK